MIPIYLHRSGDKSGLNFKDFESEILQICKQHRRDGRALAFALLLYDFTSPGVWKVLDDQRYWLAIDKAAGKTISIFSIHTPPWLIQRKESKSLGAIREDDPGAPMRSIIEKYFPLGGEVHTPGLAFFQVADGNVTDAYFVKIRAKRVEDIFDEILEIVSISSDSLRNVLPENEGNTNEIFQLIVRALQNRRIGAVVRLATGTALKLKEMLGFFKCG